MEDTFYVAAGAAVGGFITSYILAQRIIYKNEMNELSSSFTRDKNYAIKQAKYYLEGNSILEKVFCLGGLIASKKFLKNNNL